MKLRHLLFGLLAGVAFVACTNDDDPAGASPVNGGDKVATAPKYMKVNFVMPGASTRGADDEAGTTGESQISDVVFLFFKGDAQVANPFGIKPGGVDAVDANGPYSSQKDSNWDGESAVVVLDNPKDIPTSLVVLINTGKEASTFAGKPLNQVNEIANYAAAAMTADGKFVMSNAVYNDASGNTVIGAPVAADNVCESPAAARSNPVQVNVERVVAKVGVWSELAEDGVKVGTYGSGDDAKDIIAKFNGWALVYENLQSYLIKNLDLDSDLDLPENFNWNDAANKRSYWAKAATYKTTTVKDTQGNDVVTGPAWNEITGAFGSSVYTQENTEFYNIFEEPDPKDGAMKYPTGNPTAVIVAAVLQVDGKPLDVYRWANTLLAEDAITTLVKNKAVMKFYTKNDAGAYIPVSASDFTVETDANVGQDYEVLKYLTTSLDYKNIYYFEVETAQDGTTTSVPKQYESEDAFNNALYDLGEFVEYWNRGATYYYVPIKQYVGKNSDNEDEEIYGVVRNNFYKLTIKGVTGLGTAVPTQNQPIIPDTPDETKKYYLAADIQVLNWNLVTQNVTLGE